MPYDTYQSPFSTRYAGPQMQEIFSEQHKFRTWRRLWIALAEVEKELGLDITDAQIAQLKEHALDINFADAEAREKIVRHDVMSHVYAYGLQCPDAKGIIHLGATSCYVGDNTDLIIMKEGLALLRGKLVTTIGNLAAFAEKYASLPTLAFTHFQPAQPTTVGKRATLWIQDLLADVEDLDYVMNGLKLLGSKGTTGTQASFLELFGGDHARCERLDAMIAEKMGFPGCYAVSGQTYSRKIDSRILNVLSGIAQSAAKFSNDIRLLQHLKEVEEPFEKSQIGSSARDLRRAESRHHGGDAVVRTHAGRFRQQTHRRRGGLPGRGRHSDALQQRLQRSRRLSESHPAAVGAGASVHGVRKHHDGRREGRRRPSGAA